VRLRALSGKACVQAQHQKHEHPDAFFGALAGRCHGDADFVDGVGFAPDRQVLSAAHFVADAPWHGDDSFEKIHDRSLLELRGIELLYCDSCFSREDFDRACGMDAYARLKERHGPQHRLLDL
jgi:hypothetical protein